MQVGSQTRCRLLAHLIFLFFEDHAFHVSVLFVVPSGPVDGERRGLKKFLVRVLLANALPVGVDLDEFLHKHGMARKQVLLGEPGVVDEGFALRKQKQKGRKSRARKEDKRLDVRTLPHGQCRA